MIDWKPYIKFDPVHGSGAPNKPGYYLVKLRDNSKRCAFLVASGHGYTDTLRWDIPEWSADVVAWESLDDDDTATVATELKAFLDQPVEFTSITIARSSDAATVRVWFRLDDGSGVPREYIGEAEALEEALAEAVRDWKRDNTEEES